MENRHASAFEFADRDAVIDIATFGQTFVDRDRAACEHARDAWIAEHPARKVDVVHAAIEEQTARCRRESHEKAIGIVFIDGLRANHERPADNALANLVEGIAITRVETAHETDHDLQLRESRAFFDNPIALRQIQRQRFFAEHMLAGAQCRDDLVGVQRRRRDEPDGIKRWILQQRLVIVVEREFGQVFHRPFTFGGNRAARGGERRARHVPREVARVTLAEPSQSNNPNPHRRFHAAPSLMIVPSRHERVAASASSSAFRPSATVVRTGLPCWTASKKCAISSAYAARYRSRKNASGTSFDTAVFEYAVTSVGRTLPACNMPLLPSNSKRWS